MPTVLSDGGSHSRVWAQQEVRELAQEGRKTQLRIQAPGAARNLAWDLAQKSPMDAANSYITQSVLTVGSGTADEREASALTSDGSVDKFRRIF